jgi:hypothetical protein
LFDLESFMGLRPELGQIEVGEFRRAAHGNEDARAGCGGNFGEGEAELLGAVELAGRGGFGGEDWDGGVGGGAGEYGRAEGKCES